VINVAKYCELRKLRSPTFKLYLYMYLHANRSKGLHPTLTRTWKELATGANMSTGSIHHALKLLAADDWISINSGSGPYPSVFTLVREVSNDVH